jgi:aerobic carbon-monoxide dehydrogenase large subunit
LSAKTFGQNVRRVEDPDLLRGAARFVDDIHLPGMLQAAFVRSPHAHAVIRGIDTASVRALPGVHAVYAFADLKPHLRSDRLRVALPSPSFRQQVDRPVLAIDEVTHVGEPVAVVITDDRYTAEDAAALLNVEYEPLPAVSDCRAALERGAAKAHKDAPHNLVAEFDLAYGNVEAAFTGAARVFRETLWQHRGGSHSIECRGVVASHDRIEERLTLYSSTQTPHVAMRLLCELLGRNENEVRVVAPDVGGGFGPKLVFYQEEIVTALAAILLRRPVKWIEDRREHFISTTQERDQYWDVEIAVGADARIRGVRGTLIHDHGAYTARGVNVPYGSAAALPLAYEIPAYRLDIKLALTNKVPVTPVRGAGQPQGVFAIERLLDRVAQALSLDRAEVRRRNLVPADKMPRQTQLATRGGMQVVLDSGDYPACQQAALSRAGWDDFLARQRQARSEGRYLGIGLANFVEGTGRGPFEPVTVRIAPSGKIHVYSGAVHMGQSTKTMLAQVVAEMLGGDMAHITVTTGDSAATALGLGGFNSRQAVLAGSSAHRAALKVREQALNVASHLLEAAPGDLDIAGAEIHVKGAPELKVTLADVARATMGTPGFYLPGGAVGMEATEHVVIDAMSYANGTAVAEVEADPETGFVALRNLVIAHDCGRVIHPQIVEGQILGGAAHGIGNTLFERLEFDADAQPLTTTLADYLLVTATELPMITLVHQEHPTPLNPLGIKGVGEAGTLPTAAAIISAIEDALSPFGVRLAQTPVSPAELVAKVAEAKGVVAVDRISAHSRVSGNPGGDLEAVAGSPPSRGRAVT